VKQINNTACEHGRHFGQLTGRVHRRSTFLMLVNMAHEDVVFTGSVSKTCTKWLPYSWAVSTTLPIACGEAWLFRSF